MNPLKQTNHLIGLAWEDSSYRGHISDDSLFWEYSHIGAWLYIHLAYIRGFVLKMIISGFVLRDSSIQDSAESCAESIHFERINYNL